MPGRFVRVRNMKEQVADLEKRKLSAADFGGTLAMLGQRFASPADAPPAP